MSDPTAENATRERDAAAALISAVKAHTLYPPDHGIPRESFRRLLTSIAKATRQEEPFVIDITRDGISCRGMAIYAATKDDDPFCTPMFRDGITQIEFRAPINSQEATLFLHIICRYKHLSPEPEEDIATALWRAGFTSIRHTAVESIFEKKDDFTFDRFRIGMDKSCAHSIEHIRPHKVSINASKHRNLLRLSPQEKTLLKSLVDQDAGRDKDEDLIDVLIVALKHSKRGDDCWNLLTFLADEFAGALGQGRFDLSFRILEVIREHAAERFGPKLNMVEFKQRLFGPALTAALRSALDRISDDKVLLAKRIFIMMGPDVVPYLADVLETSRSRQRSLVLEIMAALATDSVQAFEGLLSRANEPLVRDIVKVLGSSHHPGAVRLIRKASGHERVGVRYEATLQLIRRGQAPEEVIFELIGRLSDDVRKHLLQRLSRTRSKVHEDLLRRYLQMNAAELDESGVVLCYLALGKCGSNDSLDYLRRQLLESPVLTLFRSIRRAHIRGAAVALLGIGTREAKEVLACASQSSAPWVRTAYRRALEMNPASGFLKGVD